MKTPLGVPKGFEELDRNAVSMDLDGFSVRVASLTDLMRMKRAAARPKDLLALEELGAIVERMDLEDRERRDRASRDEPNDAPTA